MIVYQLVASGPYLTFDGSGVISSRKVYKSRERAMEDKDEFIAKCTATEGVRSIRSLEKVDKLDILELELVD